MQLEKLRGTEETNAYGIMVGSYLNVVVISATGLGITPSGKTTTYCKIKVGDEVKSTDFSENCEWNLALKM